MNFLNPIYTKIILVIQIFLIMIFVIFEELIWDVFAKPIYEYISKLEILRTLQVKLKHANRYLILIIFVILFAMVEAAGVYAGLLLFQGDILLAIAIYMSKIPIAAFTFWLFGVTKDQLLSFEWFKWLYGKITSAFDWIKHTGIYQDVKRSISEIKTIVALYKSQLSSGESGVATQFMRLYIKIKRLIRGN